MEPKSLDWEQVTPYSFNYVDKEQDYNKDHKKFIVSTPLRYNGKSVILILKGELTTDGVNVASFDKTIHTLGLSLSQPEDLENLKELSGPFNTVFPNVPSEWDVKELLKKDVLYLKLKTKEGQYRFKSDIKMDPEDPKKCSLTRKDVIEAKVELQAYINFKDQFGGFFFDVLEIKTKTTPAIKRRKKED
jgi:hypothetical protein